MSLIRVGQASTTTRNVDVLSFETSNNVNEHNGSSVNTSLITPSGDSSSSNHFHRSSRLTSNVRQTAGFEKPAQSSCDSNLRTTSTGATREFGEFHQHPQSDTHLITQELVEREHEGLVSATTTTTTEKIHNDQQSRYSISNIPLTRPPLPQSATQGGGPATAAEIALGLSSPYNLQADQMNQYSMGGNTRTRSRDWNTIRGRKDQDQGPFVENLSEVKDRDAEDTSRTSAETGNMSSPGRLTPMHDSSDHETSDLPRIMIGTPSTVSTAPSTDDASLGNDYKLDDTVLPHLLHPGPGQRQHRRGSSGSSWGEEAFLPGVPMPLSPQHRIERGTVWSSQPHPSQRPWGAAPRGQQQQQQPQQRVASFRQGNEGRNAYAWSQPHTQHSGHFPRDQQYFQQPSHGRPMGMDARQPQGYSHNGSNFPSHQQSERRGLNPRQQMNPHALGGGLPPVNTPPRAVRGQRQQGVAPSTTVQKQAASPSSPHQGPVSNQQRSSAEILKTLLRKKACLYEPDTSRAVALVTWLVGRELAIEYGFFSRQQLQSGVHACVASKIDGGIITRTKVNRCMQIILNSCFHYIIPRSDGTEEKGDYFREGFAKSVKDDTYLLRYLSRLWNDVTVDRETVLEASLHDIEETPSSKPSKASSTPKSSPKLSSVDADKSPKKYVPEHDHFENKRAVLLCFNENVRSAEDVFRCHNEFIRDTANAVHLQLTAQEWRQFFGREAGNSPHLLGRVGIPMSMQDAPGGPDLLGRMIPEEAGKFRTSWCTKRYDHDHELCGFAHVEINNGWLRRNPTRYPYQDEICQFVSISGNEQLGHFYLNECPKGLMCDKAHSTEEMIYHPNRYKCNVCSSLYSQSGACTLGDVCPHLHPQDSTRPPKKPSEMAFGARNGKKAEQPANVKATSATPIASPVVYASPAPLSSFERQLMMPGLQNLYRRHSSVIRAHVRTSGKCTCCYNAFGDDLGISLGSNLRQGPRLGLPPAIRS